MEEVVCPKCHSNQISANAQGFNETAATIGMLTGNMVTGIGMGMSGSGKIMITCIKCGNKFKAGDGSIRKVDENGLETIEKQIFIDKDKIRRQQFGWILIVILVFMFYGLYSFFSSTNINSSDSTNTTQTNAMISSNSGANIRAFSSKESNVVVKLSKNDRINVIDYTSYPDVVNGVNGFWYKVSLENGGEGFIWSKTVKID